MVFFLFFFSNPNDHTRQAPTIVRNGVITPMIGLINGKLGL